jgi:hypothetical protein
MTQNDASIFERSGNIKDYVGRILGIFSQSQLRIHFVKSQYMFRGVNCKIPRLSKVLLQLMEKGSDNCFEVIYDSLDKLL